MSDIKVRVGQQNAVKVVASISGSAGGQAVTAENVIGGIASVTELNVSEDVYIEGKLGIGTLSSTASPNTNLIVNGDARILGILSARILYSDVYGEFTGGSINARTIVGAALSVSGISTFTNGPVNLGGILNFNTGNVKIGNLFTGYFLNPNPSNPDPDASLNNVLLGNYAGFSLDSGYKNNIIGYYAGYSNTSGIENNIFGSNAGFNNQTGSLNIFLGSNTGISANASRKIILGSGYNFANLFDSPDTTKDLQFAVGVRTDTNPSKYWLVGDENFNIGIGTTNPTSKLTVGGDGYFTGIVTASNFYVGNNLVGSGGSFANLYVSGVSTFIGNITGSNASFSGNVTIGGTLTYEDVTNVDAIGLVTARNGARILSGGLEVVGVSTFSNLIDSNGGLNVVGGTTLDQLEVTGVSTLAILTVNNEFYYTPSYENGVAYFDSSGLMVSSNPTSSSIDYTNYILTTDNLGIPVWSSVIDGGSY